MLSIYNKEKKILLNPNGALGWSLPAKSMASNETIYDTLKNISDSVGCIVGEIEPVAIVDNHFVMEAENLKHRHKGIAFMARSRADVDLKEALFVSVDDKEISQVNSFSNAEVITRVNSLLRNKRLSTQDNEIETNEKMNLRYKLHDLLIKRLLNHKITKKLEIEKEIFQVCEKADSVIDVSCGDSKLLDKILMHYPEIKIGVANDISWSQISLIKPESRRIVFTNHDATNLMFKNNVFDVAVCKNTLHHMPSREHLSSLLSSIQNIAKRIMIIEIENPSSTGGFPKFLNKFYYQGFLKDVGAAYINQEQFNGLIQAHFSNNYNNIRLSSIKTGVGNYMIADIQP